MTITGAAELLRPAFMPHEAGRVAPALTSIICRPPRLILGGWPDTLQP